jgi:hypothetical protein
LLYDRSKSTRFTFPKARWGGPSDIYIYIYIYIYINNKFKEVGLQSNVSNALLLLKQLSPVLRFEFIF